MKEPNYLLPKSRKSAVHWIRPTKMKTALFGEIETNGIACGVALDQRRWSECAASEPHRVTCKVCWHLANPPTPQVWT